MLPLMIRGCLSILPSCNIAQCSSGCARRIRRLATMAGTKREAFDEEGPRERKRSNSSAIADETSKLVLNDPLIDEVQEVKALLDGDFPFDLDEAYAHLIKSGSIWDEMVDLVKYRRGKPRDENPFKALARSILSQQISTLAASAITVKFIALFFPHVTQEYETIKANAVKGAPVDTMGLPFPTPAQVLGLDGDVQAKLRGAGLSKSKCTYIMDLAQKFEEGHLDSDTLTKMSDEEIYERLIAVKGIGKWTVDMFLMMTMNRPNVLACGDLGLQRNLLRFLVKQAERDWHKSANKDIPLESMMLGNSSITYREAISRLNGKKAPKKGVYMLPQEMEICAKQWEPYRTVAMWYMWQFAYLEEKIETGAVMNKY